MEARPLTHPLYLPHKDRKGLPDPLHVPVPEEQKQLKLFCPGPVSVPERVKQALNHPDIGHRESEFSELMQRSRMKLNKVFGVENLFEYTTLIINGSGSAANESVFSSIPQHTRLLILANGEFGERLVELADCHGLPHKAFRSPLGQPFDLSTVEQAIDAYAPDMIAMVHHETSTGMLNPISKVGRLAHERGLWFFVDAVSSLGAEPVNVEKNHITFCTSSSNKALASVCGLSFVCGRVDAFESLKDVKSRTRYLNLYNHYRYETQAHQTPNTPNLSVYFALDAALNEVLYEGLQQRFKRHRRFASILRRAMERMGISFFIPEQHMSHVLTTAWVPAGVPYQRLRDQLKERGFIVYGGKGELADRVFQVANLGELDEPTIGSFLDALRDILATANS